MTYFLFDLLSWFPIDLLVQASLLKMLQALSTNLIVSLTPSLQVFTGDEVGSEMRPEAATLSNCFCVPILCVAGLSN